MLMQPDHNWKHMPVELQPDAAEGLLLLWRLKAGGGKAFHQLSNASWICGQGLKGEGMRCGAEAA